MPLRATLLGVLLFAFPVAGWGQGAPGDLPEYLEMEVATVGMDLRTGAPLALLHAEWEQVLPIWIGETEAQAIALAREGVAVPRPQTHDLLTAVVAALGGSLEEIRVHDLREGTYYGSLHIRVGGELKEIDSRPSDALALAVRTGARISVAARLIETSPDVEFISAHGERAIVRVRGVTVAAPSAEDRARLDLSPEQSGAVVLHADPPIGARGLRHGDLVTEVRGRPIRSALDFLEEVGGQPASSTLSMRVVRDGEEQAVEVPPRRPPGPISQ